MDEKQKDIDDRKLEILIEDGWLKYRSKELDADADDNRWSAIRLIDCLALARMIRMNENAIRSAINKQLFKEIYILQGNRDFLQKEVETLRNNVLRLTAQEKEAWEKLTKAKANEPLL